MMQFTPFYRVSWMAAFVAMVMTNALSAATDTFVVNPDLSSLSLSGTVAGQSAKEQASGSMTTQVGGKITIEQAGSFLQFPGGSQLILYTNGTWQPALGGGSGSAPGNFGGKASLLFLTAYAALRNTQFDVTSPALSLTSDTFDSGSLSFGFLTNSGAVFDYNVGTFGSGSVVLTGLSTNNVTTKSSLSTTGGVQTLTIPIDTKFYMKLLVEGDTVLNIKGQIVATRTVQAPVQIGQITVAGQTITLKWSAAAGQKFIVRSSSDLKIWATREANLTSVDGNYSWSGAVSGTAEFFQLAQ